MIETVLTTYDKLRIPHDTWKMRSPVEVVEHLNKHHDNAVLFKVATHWFPIVALWDGFDGSTFYIQKLPFQDPGDAIPVDGDAAEAVMAVLGELK